MTSDSRLIVLRFRDIELSPGETITRHRRTIAQHGYCWWGWLFRDYERNPYQELLSLVSEIGAAGDFPLGLLDTGRGLLFRSVCRQLAATKTLRRTPEPLATPSYYNDRRAPAWFQLVEIEDADLSMVIGRTCIAMPSASEECFVDMLGQTVTSIGDLRRQEVTLWVLG